MSRFFILMLCAVVCSGCAGHVTRADLKEKYDHHAQFDVDSSLQTTIKNIENKLDECRIAGVGWSPVITIFEELGEARMEYKFDQNHPFAYRIHTLVELKRQNNRTNVALYTVDMQKRVIRTLEYGAKGLPGCP